MNHHFTYPRIHSQDTTVSPGHSDISSRYRGLGHKKINSVSVSLVRDRRRTHDFLFISYHLKDLWTSYVMEKFITSSKATESVMVEIKFPYRIFQACTGKQSCEQLGLVLSNLTKDNTKLPASCCNCL